MKHIYYDTHLAFVLYSQDDYEEIGYCENCGPTEEYLGAFDSLKRLKKYLKKTHNQYMYNDDEELKALFDVTE